MSNYKKYAERELQALGYDLNDKEHVRRSLGGIYLDGPNKWIIEAIFELLDVFGKQGHSGFSASYCVNVFKKLALFEPLSPLTGNNDEWDNVEDDLWQNNRCFHVFKGKDNKAYDINGKIFIDSDGISYTSKDSCVFIDFPYSPISKYINDTDK